MFPLLSIFYLIAPKSRYGLFIRKPFIKFICHTASYLTFLFLLFLASQHLQSDDRLEHRQGPPPTIVEWIILPWVLGNNTHTYCRLFFRLHSCVHEHCSLSRGLSHDFIHCVSCVFASGQIPEQKYNNDTSYFQSLKAFYGLRSNRCGIVVLRTT